VTPLTGLAKWVHPAGRGPGTILALGASGYAGFSAFVPLYIDDIGVSHAGPVFFEYGVIILSVRVLFSRLPDVLGTRRGPFVALTFQITGLFVMGLWASAAGLYAATAIYAIGVSLLYPTLFPAVVDAAPEAERSQAIGTFTMFFDTAQGLGAPILGIVVSLTSERGAFLTAAVLSCCAMALHWRTTKAVTGPIDEPCPPAEPGE
jgi:MFS family permease